MPPPTNPISYKALSPEQLTTMWRSNPKTRDRPAPRVVEYDDVMRASSLDDIFPRSQNSIILFYPAIQNGSNISGHYVSLVRDPESKTIYFCDSYGKLPDTTQKKFADPRLYQAEKGRNSLIDLFLKYGWETDWSESRLQSSKPGVATCGRWSLWRCQWENLTNEQFAQFARFASRYYKIPSLDDTVSHIWK